MYEACQIETCRGEVWSGSEYCGGHFARFVRYGDPLHSRQGWGWGLPLTERLVASVHKTNSCWLWAGTLNSNGYGTIWDRGARIYVHRLMFEMSKGPIPDGLLLDHLCRVRSCCNPQHLEAVSNTENIRRGVSEQGINFRKTHCVNGHEFTPENTYLRPPNQMKRTCRACNRDRMARDRAERVA